MKLTNFERKAGLIGAGLGIVVGATLAALRLAAGPDSIPVDEFFFREYVELALAPSTLFVMMTLNASPVDLLEACVVSIAFNGVLYGAVVIVAAVAARFRDWLGVVVMGIAALWILFWLALGALPYP